MKLSSSVKDLNSDIKVAYFAGTMRPGHDGVTRVLYRLIDGLKDRGIKNIFFSPIIPSEEEQTTTMFEVPSFTFPLYKDYRVSIPGLKHFEQELMEFKPDILHINSPCSLGYAAIKYGQKFQIPVVATYHTHFASYAKYYKVKALENFSWNYFRNLYNKCERVYVPSQPIMQELNEHGLNTIEFLPHGVDTNAFNPKFKSDNWKKKLNLEGKITLLFAGRLVWEKDLLTLAKTYKILTTKHNNIAFVLAGDGPIRKELEEMMPGAVFLGNLSGTELSTAYASSDIFVFPSTTETFGNVIVEAMASGIPPVCVREGGAYGLIEDGINGLIAEPHNPADLADKIEFLLNQPALREKIALNAFTFSQTQSWDEIIDKLILSYNDVIQGYKSKTLQNNLLLSSKMSHRYSNNLYK
jgi:glycosyltransferase involved in cell wall biosynthesis